MIDNSFGLRFEKELSGLSTAAPTSENLPGGVIKPVSESVSACASDSIPPGNETHGSSNLGQTPGAQGNGLFPDYQRLRFNFT